MTCLVLDASALLVLLRGEPGAERVAEWLGIIPTVRNRSNAFPRQLVISAVNYAEILTKTVEQFSASEPVTTFIRRLSIEVVPFDESQAIATFALCGFANLSSIGIQLGGIGALRTPGTGGWVVAGTGPPCPAGACPRAPAHRRGPGAPAR